MFPNTLVRKAGNQRVRPPFKGFCFSLAPAQCSHWE